MSKTRQIVFAVVVAVGSFFVASQVLAQGDTAGSSSGPGPKSRDAGTNLLTRDGGPR